MIVCPDKTGHIDHTILKIISQFDSDGLAIVPITFFDSFVFNDALYDLKKWVLVDYCEYGANHFTMQRTHFWGKNSALFSQAQTTEYQKFDRFVKDNPPVLIFKRELLLEESGKDVYPIEFPAFYAERENQTKDHFIRRPISVLNWWGHSHESRRALHGNIFINSIAGGYGVVDNFHHFDGAINDYKNVWATIQVPHYARLPMEEVMKLNGMSKLSVSLPGAGVKCFRHSESCVNSIMVMRDDNFAWGYEWEHGKNCIKIPLNIHSFDEVKGRKNQWLAIETIEKALERDDLYDIYLNGTENAIKYYLPNYISNYINPILNEYK